MRVQFLTEYGPLRTDRGALCIANISIEKRLLAHMTHSSLARPISSDIAGLGERQEAFKPAIPWRSQISPKSLRLLVGLCACHMGCTLCRPSARRQTSVMYRSAFEEQFWTIYAAWTGLRDSARHKRRAVQDTIRTLAPSLGHAPRRRRLRRS